jgi:SMI1/KNR4 family protein SUKH-1
VKIEIRDERPPVPRERLAEAEARLAEIGTRIPPSYKAFLAEQDGGKPVRRRFSFRQHDREQHDLVRLFFGIAESPNGDLVSEADIARDSLPADVLPIATDNFDNLIVLDGREGRDGPVLFWDHEFQSDPPSEDDLFWVAPDLATFLAGLEVDPVDDDAAAAAQERKGWRRLLGRR